MLERGSQGLQHVYVSLRAPIPEGLHMIDVSLVRGGRALSAPTRISAPFLAIPGEDLVELVGQLVVVPEPDGATDGSARDARARRRQPADRRRPAVTTRVSLPVLLVATIALGWLATGCGGGYSYVHRSPLEHPLEGVARIGVRLEALTPRGEEALTERLTSREDALVSWLQREDRAASFVRLEGGEDATVHVLLTVAPREERPDPREAADGSLRIAVRITVQRGAERVAIVEGTASTPMVTFHGLIDPDLPLVLERLAHRISRVLDDLGVPRRGTRAGRRAEPRDDSPRQRLHVSR
ncbi:MAG: hypothetical protein ACK6CU_02590 [Deltaproteobacteria bacterium]